MWHCLCQEEFYQTICLTKKYHRPTDELISVLEKHFLESELQQSAMQISTLEPRLNTLESRLNALESRLNALESKSEQLTHIQDRMVDVMATKRL